jgi:hypothetical protein
MAKSQGRVSDMGTKRIGLARIEALLENLERDLALGSTTDISCGRVTTADTLFARGYTATTPSVLTKWPAASAVGDGAAKTLTIAQLLTGIMSADPTDDRAFTLPTAALAVAGVAGVAIGDCIDFTILNLGTASADEIITVAAGANGTLVGSGAVLTANPVDDAFSSGSGLFRLRFTAVTGTETYVCYRLA